MSLTQEQIVRLAKLTALQPNTNVQIDSVIDSLKVVTSLDVTHIDKVSRSGASQISLRNDTVQETENLPDELLKCSPQKVAAHQIVLAGIMQGE